MISLIFFSTIIATFIYVYPLIRDAMTDLFATASREMVREGTALLSDDTVPDDIHRTVALVSQHAHTKRFLFLMAFGMNLSKPDPERDAFVELVDGMTPDQKRSFTRFADASLKVALFSRVWGYYLCLPKIILRHAIRLQLSPRPVRALGTYVVERSRHDQGPEATV